MTKEEELDWLYRLKSEIYVYIPKEWLIPVHDALDAAINSLEQESKTGHWVVDGSVDCYLDKVRCHCSECGKKKEFPADYDHIKQKLSISYKYPEVIDNFCPNCGAKMVEISESEENMVTKEQYLEAICKAAHVDDIGDVSDGYHTFNQLYYQRMILFATLVKQNHDKAWKSLRHENGELCFGGGWFIVGIDTPEGGYTYHYEDKYFDLFDCETLDHGKHWDGHTEKDVTRLLSLQQEPCEDCII